MEQITSFFSRYKKETFIVLWIALLMNFVFVTYVEYQTRQDDNKKKEAHIEDLLIRLKKSNEPENSARFIRTKRRLEELKGRPLNDNDLKAKKKDQHEN